MSETNMPGDALVIQRGRLALRRMQDDAQDYSLMAGWLTDPRVLEFYEGRDNPFPIERVIEEYAPRVLTADGVQPCILLRDGAPVGYLQYYALQGELWAEYGLEDDGSRIYALDLFIGRPDLWGRGIGTQAVDMILEYLFNSLGAQKVVLDPHIDNHRAIRCYEKAGFRWVKILPGHELHEGELRDCYLMEIIK
jgi:aminoglycoside 6'-N-acetyltransferase